MKEIEVLMPLACNKTFSYLGSDKVQIGDYVLVPFRNSQIIGIVWQMGSGSYTYKLKAIIKRIEVLPMQNALMKTVEFVANYNLIPKGLVLKMTMQAKIADHKGSLDLVNHSNASTLSLAVEQEAAAEKLKQKISDRKFSVTLLEGISGPTNIYFAAASALKSEIGQILILVPEILLATQMIGQLQKHIGITPIEWHSALTPKQRTTAWLAVKYGEVQLIVGTRSSLLLPYNNLRLIIVDEEHDSSFKQDQRLNYNARDMAIIRAKKENILIFLVSATPSLETAYNVSLGKFGHISLNKHCNTMPHVEVIDMRKRAARTSSRWLSDKLIQALKQNFVSGKGAMIFLNRRGYNPYTICSNCKYKLQCLNCSTPLTWYEQQKHWSCNYCNYKLSKATCPDCSSELITYGAGVELIAAEIARFLPEAKTAIITSDAGLQKIKTIMKDINAGNIDVIIGTQMIAKCSNFPNLALVGIIDADMGLFGSDLRALEKTYQLLCQVASRMDKKDGYRDHVILQTCCPKNIAIKALVCFDGDAFYRHELAARKKFFMPPFSRLATITFSHKDQSKALNMAKSAVTQASHNYRVKLLGPVSAPLFLLQGKYRYKILIKANKDFNLQAYMLAWVQKIKTSARIDIDPQNFL
jgi:primosomal protein N' (replication factor Y)